MNNMKSMKRIHLVTLLAVLSHSCLVWLFTTPWIVACQTPLSMGCPRQEYWNGLPFFLQEIFPTQRSNVHLLCLLFSCIVGVLFTLWAIGVCTCSQIIVVSVSQNSFLSHIMVEPYNSSRLMWWFCGVVKLGFISFITLLFANSVLHSISASGQGTVGVQDSAFCRHVLEITHSTSAHISLARPHHMVITRCSGAL